MKKCFITIAVALLLPFLSPPAGAEEITIVGTGSGMPLLSSMGAAFTRLHPDVTVGVPESIGSGGGIKAVGADKNLIGRVARPLKDTEAHFGLTYLPFAKLPIVFFVHKSAGLTNATPKQLCDIYSGTITNWKDVGGADDPIRIVRREEGDSSLEVLTETFPGFKDITITPKSKTTFSDQETIEFVTGKNGTIAFGTYADARNADVIILTIDGKKAATPEYAYNGILALIFKEKNRVGGIEQFVGFVTSPEAREVILQAGGIPY